jgi:nitrite reductase/ring-hydroxylating ferredoxin subunit
MVETVTGGNRSAGTSYEELLDADTHPVRDILRADSPMPPGPTRVSAEVYHSREIHEREIEKLWKRTWQLACHEDELKQVGDYVVYDITRLSFIVVKSGEDQYQAFYNQCLHRGRQLCDHDGKKARHFRCSFHGWSWNLDGSLNEVPCQWDFPTVTAEDYQLPEVKVARWGGFIFVNPDPGAAPLEEHLQDLADHFTQLPFEKRYKAVHVAKVLRCNWKLAQEAFMEAYHVIATHPTILDVIGDANSKYDVFGNYSRAISPQQVESPHIAHYTPDPQAREFTRWKHPLSGLLYELGDDGLVHVTKSGSEDVSRFRADGAWVDGPITHVDPNMCNWVGGKQLPDSEALPLGRVREPGPGESKRSILAAEERERLRPQLGDLMDQVADADLVDVSYFSVFPNWHPWGCFNPIFYRFRPNGDTPHECIHECWYMLPVADGEERPAPAPIHWLEADDDYTDAPELGALAKVFNQDVHNLPQVHRGLQGMKNQQVIFADYQESKIRHFHQLYRQWMELEE